MTNQDPVLVCPYCGNSLEGMISKLEHINKAHKND